jgi:hypothetical protein
VHVDLTEPGMWERNEFCAALAWLRDNEPVYRHPEPDGDGFWVLTRYADVAQV